VQSEYDFRKRKPAILLPASDPKSSSLLIGKAAPEMV
jgi:hypothetical protein